MLKLKVAVIAALAALVIVGSSVFAQDSEPVPDDLQSFLLKLHDLSVAQDMKSLEMCILPYFGLNVYGYKFHRHDFEDAMGANEAREFQHEYEGMIRSEFMKPTEFLFSQYHCFGLLAYMPFKKGMMANSEDIATQPTMDLYYESGCDFLAFVMEDYENGDIVYGVTFSPDGVSQFVTVGKIAGNWYILSIDPYE